MKAQISSMQPHEVTIELIDLADRAAEHERWLLSYLVTGQDVAHVSPQQLRETLATLPENEQRLQLVTARRLIGIGQSQYGALDPQRDRRDWDAELCAELVDGVVYLLASLRRSGKRHALLGDSVDLMRRAVGIALRQGSL